MKEALTYPTDSTFAKVTGLTNRPLSLKDSKLPQDDRLQLVPGIDLTGQLDAVVSAMKQKIKDVDTVSHVIFTAYIEKPDYDALRKVNTELLRTAITAIDQLAPNLKAVTLQTGGKAYGVEFSKDLKLNTPFKESMPRIPKPCMLSCHPPIVLKRPISLIRFRLRQYLLCMSSQSFLNCRQVSALTVKQYNQHDTLADLSKDKSWTFSETRPDVIIGFTPGSNFMNCAQGLGIWLSLAREVHGAGAEIPFPGTQKSWKNLHTDTFQDVLGKMDIYTALNHDKCGNGGTFNVADGEVVTCTPSLVSSDVSCPRQK